ncbi:Uncharacterised protein [Mycobacteroides abscessus subsp. abscessus]|nr:Uncharacterised protein [Mycobacteroides abscessus subsp. abscessus]
MRLDGILRIREHHGDPALREMRGGRTDLAQYHDLAATPVHRQRGRKSGDTRTDDDHICVSAPGGPRRHGHSPPPGCPISIIRWTLRRARRAVSGSTSTSSRPSTRHRNNAAGVIIFM